MVIFEHGIQQRLVLAVERSFAPLRGAHKLLAYGIQRLFVLAPK